MAYRALAVGRTMQQEEAAPARPRDLAARRARIQCLLVQRVDLRVGNPLGELALVPPSRIEDAPDPVDVVMGQRLVNLLRLRPYPVQRLNARFDILLLLGKDCVRLARDAGIEQEQAFPEAPPLLFAHRDAF